MIVERERVTAGELLAGTGWDIKPQGACRGHECVPLPGVDTTGDIDAEAFASAMGMPLVRDHASGVAAIGPRAAGSVLASASVPPIVLDDFGGDAFDLASLRGRKVLLIAWASW